jgi:hypothetical protein
MSPAYPGFEALHPTLTKPFPPEQLLVNVRAALGY